jgi:hypothetical protein
MNISTDPITTDIIKAAEDADANDLAKGLIDAAGLLGKNCNALREQLLINAAKLRQERKDRLDVTIERDHYKFRAQNMERVFGSVPR